MESRTPGPILAAQPAAEDIWVKRFLLMLHPLFKSVIFFCPGKDSCRSFFYYNADLL